ncbi:hypothetical protein DLI08_24555 [Vibrio parahaemolyticus]|nr:hypothetical protein [Vibrio parahaemolyticus]EGX6076708.1 hypothetical protein [Vibrio parahaemolyticus]
MALVFTAQCLRRYVKMPAMETGICCVIKRCLVQSWINGTQVTVFVLGSSHHFGLWLSRSLGFCQNNECCI